MNIGIVIPVFNRWAQTQRCLESLRASQCQEFSVYVVDHGSTDGTACHLNETFPEYTRLAGEPSWWWTAATNAGIRHALREGATYVMLLNNDCVVEPETIGRVLEQVRRSSRLIAAPVQVSLQTGIAVPYKKRTALTLGFPTLTDLCPLPVTQAGWEPVRLLMGGRGVVIPAAVFTEIGLLDDEHLPHYASDHDFYLRARKAGWTLGVVSEAFLRVDDSTTTLASRAWELSLRRFLETLRERRSHRNLRDLQALFRKHYPVRRLAGVGVALNLARYVLIFMMRRPVYLVVKNVRVIRHRMRRAVQRKG